jgi:rhamnulokinase
MGRYLSLDMGAESGRLVIVDFSDVISTEVIYRFETPIMQDALGRRCWILKIVEEVVTALTAAAPRGPFTSLAVDTWGLDFGLLDVNSQLISNPVSHRDHRTDGYLKKAGDIVGVERLHFETGAQLLEINSIFQLMAIQITAHTNLSGTALLMMPDLILFALTGQIGMEYTIASTTGLYDTQGNEWAIGLARDLNIPSTFGRRR